MRTTYNIEKWVFPLLFILILSCGQINKKADDWDKLSEAISLRDLNKTLFAPTLQYPIPGNKNIIYTPALLFAWEKVEEKLKSEVIVDSNFSTLDFIVNSNTYHGSLKEGEYSVTAESDGQEITVKAFFNKTLPFESKFHIITDPLSFNNAQISAFGMEYFDDVITETCKILYYDSDEKFILKLSPRDKEHEIILSKGLPNVNTLMDAIRQSNLLKDKGLIESNDPRHRWKYEISPGDIISIPVMNFNLETNYPDLEGHAFLTADKKKHVIIVAYQRTGFILNETGAVVESEVVMTVDSTITKPIITHPKKMIFNKPYLIVIKRINTQHPYLVMKVENEELMIKK